MVYALEPELFPDIPLLEEISCSWSVKLVEISVVLCSVHFLPWLWSLSELITIGCGIKSVITPYDISDHSVFCLPILKNVDGPAGFMRGMKHVSEKVSDLRLFVAVMVR